MEILETEKYYIITPLSPKLSERESLRLAEEIACIKKRVGIDMSFVKDCTIDFIYQLSRFNVSLFNIQSDIFAILISMNMDKTWQLFVSEMDFSENKHRLLKRNFSIV